MALTKGEIEFLARVPLFSALTVDERTRLGSYLRATDYDEGQVVIWEGKPHEDLFVLVEGSVVVTEVVRGEVESVLARLGPGTHFGELDFIDGRNASATVTAERPSRVIAVSSQRLHAILDEDGQLFGKIAWALLTDLAAKLRATNLRFLEAVTWGLDAAAIDPAREDASD